MENKEMNWKLEEETQQPEEKAVESRIDKLALAEFILSKLPGELVEMLEKGESPQNLITMWENRMLKKEKSCSKCYSSLCVRSLIYILT